MIINNNNNNMVVNNHNLENGIQQHDLLFQQQFNNVVLTLYFLP